MTLAMTINDAICGASAELLALLRRSGMRIAFAESCTGGLLASALTHHPGASEALEMSFVTYCDRAKNEVLGVPQQVLDAYTAVSAHTAAAMAEGALVRSGADIAVSVTGLAGPGGGTAERPVGLVYIGIAGLGALAAYCCCFPGDRAAVRAQAALKALQLARQRIMSSKDATDPAIDL